MNVAEIVAVASVVASAGVFIERVRRVRRDLNGVSRKVDQLGEWLEHRHKALCVAMLELDNERMRERARAALLERR